MTTRILRSRVGGFSLLEAMIGMSLLGLLGLGVAELMSRLAERTSKMSKETMRHQDKSMLDYYLTNNLPSGNIRFVSYTSNGTRVRILFPLVEQCADLSTDAPATREEDWQCRHSVSFLFTRYEKTTTPAVSTICQLGAPGDSTRPFLIDLANSKFGQGEFSDAGVLISSSMDEELFPLGRLNLKRDALVAFLLPPNGHVFRVRRDAQVYTPVQDRTDETFSRNPELNEDCIRQLQVARTVSGVRRFDVSKLVRVELEPLLIKEMLAVDTPPTIDSLGLEIADYPIRTFNITLETFGIRKKLGDTYSAGINRCRLSSGNLDCSEIGELTIPGVQRLRIDETFKISLMNASGTILDKSQWYELLASRQTPTCPIPYRAECGIRKMIVNAGRIPAVVSSSETKNKMLAETFSLLKQNELESLRIRYVVDKNAERELGIRVFFP